MTVPLIFFNKKTFDKFPDFPDIKHPWIDNEGDFDGE